MTNIFVSVALLILIYQTIWFFVSLIAKRNDVADLAWGLGFVVVCIYLLIVSPTSSLVLISVLTLIWGLRLASHIFSRLKKTTEDSRYLAWRQEWGSFFILRSYLQVYLLQGVFMYTISLSAIISATSNSFSPGLSVAGALVWLVGFLFESVADKQLSEFVKTKKPGQIMQSGLWRYSRHPNYFGEVTQWWGIFLVALSAGNIFALLSPATITILILFVSGVPLLEKRYNGLPDWEVYKNRTSAFIPWWPKRQIK